MEALIKSFFLKKYVHMHFKKEVVIASKATIISRYDEASVIKLGSIIISIKVVSQWDNVLTGKYLIGSGLQLCYSKLFVFN